jgi:hypothetical protein
MGTDRHLYVGEVAKLIGVSPSRIRMWENDRLLTVRRLSATLSDRDRRVVVLREACFPAG